MKLSEAKLIAEAVQARLAPHCERIEIAGSIRREKPEVKDIEIVCIAKPYETGLFASGIATVVDSWPKVKGELPCLYTQRLLPEGIALDLFFAQRENWGWILPLRTGSSDWNVHVLLPKLKKAGYELKEGHVWANGRVISVPEERNLFDRAGMDWVEPKHRRV